MYFKLSTSQENSLLNLPETGMGYQIIEANKAGSYSRSRYLALNSEIIIEVNGYEGDHVRKVIHDGIFKVKALASELVITNITVLNEKQFRNQIRESKNENEKGAIENPVVNASGDEVFVRLSAFSDDRRIDKINKRLLPGSFTTTMDDYLKCKASNDNPNERYALPNNDKIQFTFHIKPLKSDTLQKGIVQAANDKRGGGKEAYFANGTAVGTFLLQTPY
jgi:hypothetical protein